MRYSFDQLPVHPVTAYASGDFNRLRTADKAGRIASRCVGGAVDTGAYRGGRVYGVSERGDDDL